MAGKKNDQQVREITEKLEQGIKELFESEKFKEYLTTMSKFYHYSFNNTLLIAMQKPDATYVAGYTSWQKNFDRHVMKGEKGIKIIAPAPKVVREEREKLDPDTQKPILDEDGKPVTEVVEKKYPNFTVVSVFDVSQTDGKELPNIIVDELTGSVENYAAFFEALKQESPVPITFEGIPSGAKGYFSHVETRIAIQEGMSEIQTIKTAIHEIAHAKLHAVDPEKEVAPEDRKDRHTKEVEAESVAYTVCQRYGIETSDYSFGYIAGWSSDKETKELKGSLETIRNTAAEMIESLDAKLKVLLAEKEQAAEVEEIKPSFLEVPVYREMANYAYEAGELEQYRSSLAANIACRDAIEQAVGSYHQNNRLDAKEAVQSVLEQFSPERVSYVLANTIQQKDSDGRISHDSKDWAKAVEVCPENATQFIDHKEVDGQTFYLMEHDTHGDEAACLIVDERGKLSLSDVYNGFDEHTVDLLHQEVMPVDRLPDETISVDEMKEYGYAWGGMLPLREDAAAEVMKSCTVYRLYGDNTEGLVLDAGELQAHAAQGGIFGVEKTEWNAALERENPLKAAEMSLEDDYGMIDGIINNGPKEPEKSSEHGGKASIMERLRAAKAEQKQDKPSPHREKKSERDL